MINRCYCKVILSNGGYFYNMQKVFKTVDTEWLKANYKCDKCKA